MYKWAVRGHKGLIFLAKLAKVILRIYEINKSIALIKQVS